MHPALRILAYLCSALVIPGLNFFQMTVLSLTLGPFGLLRRARIALLFRRTRLLFLVMLLVYAYSLPGQPLLTGLYEWSPSREGIATGLQHVWRLALLLLLLDLLILRMTPGDLLTGIYGMLHPFPWTGLDPARVALRLSLTLEALERPGDWRELRQLLDISAPVPAQAEVVELQLRRFTRLDWFVAFLLIFGLILWFTV